MVRTRVREWSVALWLLVLGVAGAQEGRAVACARALHQLGMDLVTLQPNALRMAESSEWLPRGLLAGQTVFLGRYDECLATEKARYCVVSLCLGHPGVNGLVPCPPEAESPYRQLMNVRAVLAGKRNGDAAALRFGLCLPEACAGPQLDDVVMPLLHQIEDVVIGLQETVNWLPGYSARLPARLHVPRSACWGAEDPPRAGLRTADWAAGAALAVMMLAAAAARGMLRRRDLARTDHKSATSHKAHQDHPPAYHPRDLSLPILDGLRVLSTYAVVVCHTYVKIMLFPLMNPAHFAEAFKFRYTMLIKATIYSVDSFFVLSGLLVAYTYLNRVSENRSIPWKAFYVHRLIRLYPALIATLLISRLLPMLEAGPLWWETMRCDFNWTDQLLFMDNLREMPCVGYLWYLSADMQMYVVAPLALVALHRRPRRALQALALLAAGGLVLRFWLSYWYKLIEYFPLLGLGTDIIEDGHRLLYYASYTRYPPFVVGMLLGYALHKTRHERKPQALPRRTVIGLWVTCCSMAAAAILPIHRFSQLDRPYNRVTESLFVATSHTAWALALAAFILLASAGRGGPVARFLSDPRWRPLSRISYAIYLVHFPLERALLAVQRSPSYAGRWEPLTGSLALFTLCVPFALVLCKLFEEPVHQLERLLGRLLTRGDAKGQKKEVELGGKDKSEEHRRMV